MQREKAEKEIKTEAMWYSK